MLRFLRAVSELFHAGEAPVRLALGQRRLVRVMERITPLPEASSSLKLPPLARRGPPSASEESERPEVRDDSQQHMLVTSAAAVGEATVGEPAVISDAVDAVD